MIGGCDRGSGLQRSRAFGFYGSGLRGFSGCGVGLLGGGGGGLRVSEFGGLGFWTYSQLSESRLKGWRSGVLNDDS